MKNFFLSPFLLLMVLFGQQYANAQITGNAQVCAGSSYSYSTTLGGTLTWNTVPAGASVIATGNTAQITWSVSAGAYTVSVTDGNTTQNFTVNVYDIPTPTIQYNKNPCAVGSENGNGGAGGPDAKCDTFCVNEVVTYTVTNIPGNTYTWQLDPSGGTILSGQGTNSVNVIWAPGGGGSVQGCRSLCVTETNPAGCAAQACVHGVSAFMASPITLTANPSYVCLGNAIVFTANSAGTFQNYTWDFGNAVITTTGSNTISYIYPLAGTYTVIVTGNTKCCHTSDTITVVVDSLPGPDIYCITPVCANTEGVQYCTSATNCTFNWVVTGGTIVSGAGTSCITVDWGAGPVGTIAFTTTNCNPALCPATTVATVPIMPSGPFTINGPTVVCKGQTGTYSAPYVPGSQYTWTLTNPLSVSTLLNGTPPYIVDSVFNLIGTYTLTCHMVNDILDCVGDGIITIDVRDSYFVLGPPTTCADPVNGNGFSAYLSNFTPLNCNWTASAPATSIGSVTGVPSASFVFPSAGTYTVTATASLPNTVCNSPQTITVTVNPIPATPVITGPLNVCPGGTYSYSTSGYSPSATYAWLLFDGVNYTSGSGSTFNATFPAGFTSGTVSVSVYENGCAATSTINITSFPIPAPTISGATNVCPDMSTTYNITLSYPGNSTVAVNIVPANAGVVVSQTNTTVVIKWFVINPSSATINISETICGNLTGVSNTLNINILPTPTPTATATGGCNGVNVSLSATGGVSYSWYLATGGPSLGTGNPQSTPYVAPGNYYVVATGANGCQAKAYALAPQLPTPNATIFGPLTAACDPATGNFSSPVALSTLNGPGYSFSWSNGATTYNTSVASSGTFTVTVTNTFGCSATDVHSVTCACGNPCPTCVDGGACTGGILNTPYTLTAPSGSSYLWNTGSTAQSITVTAADSLYSVTVIDNSNLACPQTTYSYYVYCTGDPCPYSGGPTCVANTPTVTVNTPYCNSISFQTNTTGTCNGSAVWDFGDGSPLGSGANVTHNYTQVGTYTVCYSFSGNSPCDPGATACTSVTVPVAANFSLLVNCSSVQFSDLSNFLSGSISAWSWNFGDFSPLDPTQNPTHLYANGGTYNVTLTVTVGSCQAQITLPVTIVSPNITASIASTACNAPVAFFAVDNGSNPPVVSWNWNFGDATFSALQNPTHTFPAPPPYSYTVTVTATSGAGCTTTAQGVVSINPPPPPLVMNDTMSCGAMVIGAPAGYTSYQWNSNGTPIPGATAATYLITQTGNYSVTVTNVNGCVITSNLFKVTINPLPPVSMNVSPQPVCSTGNITVNSNTSGNVTVIWSSNVPNVPNFQGYSIQWSNVPPGNYTASCVITDNTTGCVSNGTISFTVNPSPTVSITNSNPGGLCSGNPITLTAVSSPVISYAWSNGGITPVISVITGGLYSVTVTDALGCTAVATSLAKIFPLPDLQMLPIGCDSACDNPVTDTIHGPPGMMSYDWQINGVSVWNMQDLALNPGNLPNYNVPYLIKLITTTLNGCTDSTNFYYTPKDCDTTESHCYSLKDTIWCNTDGTYSFQISMQNNNASSSASIMMNDFTLPFAVNNTSYYYQFLNVPPNGNSGWFPSTPLTLSVPAGDSVPPEFCFHTIVIYGDTCCNDSLCIPIPNCVPCDNISVSSTDDSSCCHTVSLSNTYNGNYFSGIQVTPISAGATIGSTYLGGGYTGTWNSPVNNASTVIYQPNTGFIPTGNTNGLFTMCLNLAPGAATPQIVVVDWLVPAGPDGDSIACSDTLKWYCEPPPLNMCGTVKDTITCLGDGSYQYTFTLTNNSANAINMAAIDYINPQGSVNFPNYVFFFNPALAPDSSATQTFTFTPSLPAGSQICYHITLLDSIGCCCHAVDTVCFTLPSCNDTVPCACGHWDLFGIHVSPPPAGSPSDFKVECGALVQHLKTGVSISLTGGGYVCSGDSTCTPTSQWKIPGASPSSGTGYPSFILNNPGNYTLTVYGYCGGHLCDSCFIKFEVDTNCACGSWNIFSATIQPPVPDPAINFPVVECGTNFTQLKAGTVVTFTGGGYTCNGDASCTSSITWNIVGGVPSSGTGLPVFTLNNPGTFTLTLHGSCGGNACDSCIMKFVVDSTCDCGVWKPFTISTSLGTFDNQACGATFNSKKGVAITLNGTYQCSGGVNCNPVYSWTIFKNNNTWMTGTTLPISFTPLQAATFVVSITATCNGHTCETCTFTFNVQKGIQPFGQSQNGLLARSTNDIDLSAKPNPAHDVVTIRLSSTASESGVLYLYNDLGIAVKQYNTAWTKNTEELEINVSDLPAGVYLVQFKGETGNAFVRVIIER